MKYLSLVLGLMLSSLFGYGQNIPDSVKTRSAAEIEPRNETTGGEGALILHSDGDIEMGDYTSLRPFSIYPKNFAAWDNDGVMQKYEIQELIDTVSNSIFGFGDNNEGTTEQNALAADRYINQNGFAIIQAADQRVSTGVTDGKIVRSIVDLQENSNVSFDEIIGTTNNEGGTDHNFTYYRSFNINPNGSLIDPTKHGWGDGYEYWYEPIAGQVYAEKHTILNIGGTTYRIDSHTLPINSPSNWSLYHTLDTWFLKSPNNDGQFVRFDLVDTQSTNFQLLASGQIQKGSEFSITNDGTNNSLQINPYGESTGKSFSISQWYDASLPSLTSLNTPGDPDGKLTFVNDRLYPNMDNDCELGHNGFRWKSLATASLETTLSSNAATSTFQVSDIGEISFGLYPNTLNSTGDPVNFLSTDASGNLRSDPITDLPQLYNPELTPQTFNFSTAPANNLYLIDLTDNLTVTVNVTDQIIGRPYKYVGYNGTTGNIDFSVSVGSTFQNNGTNSVDGIAGNFTYEVIRLSSTLYIVTQETYTLE